MIDNNWPDSYKMADISDIGPRIVEIKVPWIGPSMNTICNSRHWSHYNKAKKAGGVACHIVMRNIPPFTTPVKLEFMAIVKHNKSNPELFMYDCSNYALTNKIIEDCLVRFKILEDDTRKYVVGVNTLPPIRGDESFMTLKIIESAL